MAEFLSACTATVGIAASIYGYMSILVNPPKDAKHYVNQQLSQMQAHSYNRKYIMQAAANIDNNNKSRKGIQRPVAPVVAAIFEEYDRMIQANEWCWIKKECKIYCLSKADNPKICEEERHDGIFPPLAGLEKTLQECTAEINDVQWETKWEEAAKAYAKTYYLSPLEYYIFQIEALEQDMAIMKLKY
jgi:hypothetical protein